MIQHNNIFPPGSNIKEHIFDDIFSNRDSSNECSQFGIIGSGIYQIEIPSRVGVCVKDMRTFFAKDGSLQPGTLIKICYNKAVRNFHGFGIIEFRKQTS